MLFNVRRCDAGFSDTGEGLIGGGFEQDWGVQVRFFRGDKNATCRKQTDRQTDARAWFGYVQNIAISANTCLRGSA